MNLFRAARTSLLGDCKVYAANEEYGYLDISNLMVKLKIGDLVCPVTNLFDEVVFVKGDHVLEAAKVDERGLVQ